MQLKSAIHIWSFIVPILLATSSCWKDEVKNCLEQPTSANFRVNNTDFSVLQEKVWLTTGMEHSLLFMQELENGNQHVVNIVFIGDTIGYYPLLGINATNRASYFAPGVNGTTFPDTVLPGMLVVTNLDEKPSCLSGYYVFTVDTLEVSGEFQSLRPD